MFVSCRPDINCLSSLYHVSEVFACWLSLARSGTNPCTWTYIGPLCALCYGSPRSIRGPGSIRESGDDRWAVLPQPWQRVRPHPQTIDKFIIRLLETRTTSKTSTQLIFNNCRLQMKLEEDGECWGNERGKLFPKKNPLQCLLYQPQIFITTWPWIETGQLGWKLTVAPVRKAVNFIGERERVGDVCEEPSHFTFLSK